MTYEDFIKNDAAVIKKDQIDILAYDPEWPTKAKMEIDKLKTILPIAKILDIQHVGSTAIPGMSSKPILDIQIIVTSLEEMRIIAIPALQKIGYEFWHDNPDPKRLFFVKGMPPYGEKRTHHIHIIEEHSKGCHDKIFFRDYLIIHPHIAKEYEELKIKFAKQYANDREKYTDAKSDFIHKILNLNKEKRLKGILTHSSN